MTTVRLWAHQGGAREAPSNTIHAMRRALDAGADALEMDVHRTRDGRIVVAHDRRLGRISNGTGRLRSMTLGALQRDVDPAYWWVPGKVSEHDASDDAYTLRGRHRTDPTLRMPSLDEVFDAFGGVPMTIEVKAWRAAAPLTKLLRERRPPGVTVTSFFTLIVWRLRLARLPDGVTIAPALAFVVWFWLRTKTPLLGRLPARHPYTRIQVPRAKFVMRFDTRAFVDAAHDAGLAVDYWTIDSVEEMAELVGVGADGIMTDRPAALAAARR